MNKFGIFIGSLEGGGAERVVLNLANELHKRGVDIILILRFKKGPYLKALNQNIKVIELKSNNPVIIILRIIKVCKKKKIERLLTVSRYNNVIGLIANKFLRIKIIIREASTFDGIVSKGSIKNTMLLKLMKILYPTANFVIANSHDTANDINMHINIKKNKLIVINNPLVNNEILKLSKEKIANDTFNKLSRPIIISVGRLVAAKNISYLIRSFKKVKSEFHNANLVIIGDGPLKNQLITLSKELDVENNVYFIGYVDNPYKYLKLSDVFVLSSLYEGFGNVIVEALSVGLPVVSVNCAGGPSEILNNGEFGDLSPLDNENAFAAAIIKSLVTKHNKRRLIERANFFSIERITDEYYDIIFNH